MSKHTPGPWRIGMRPGRIVYGADSSQVADLRGDLRERDEALANARLIAAAPDLLAALREILDETPRGFTETAEILMRARAAIAAAAEVQS